MNDHEAIEQIDLAMQAFYVGIHDQTTALNKIAYILGANVIEHAEAKANAA